MGFDPNRRADIVLRVEETDTREALAPRADKASALAKRSGFENEYDAEAALAMNDITELAADGRALRAEAERFIVWRASMGEGSESTKWGPTQRAYTAGEHVKQRAKAAKLKSDIESKGMNPAKFLDFIFAEKNLGHYDINVTKQARGELGLPLTEDA